MESNMVHLEPLVLVQKGSNNKIYHMTNIRQSLQLNLGGKGKELIYEHRVPRLTGECSVHFIDRNANVTLDFVFNYYYIVRFLFKSFIV